MKCSRKRVFVVLVTLVLFTSVLMGVNVVSYEEETNTGGIKHITVNDDPYFPIGWYGGPGYKNNIYNPYNEGRATNSLYSKLNNHYDSIDLNDTGGEDNVFKNTLSTIRNSGSNTIFFYEQNSIATIPQYQGKGYGFMSDNFQDLNNVFPTGYDRMLDIANAANLKVIVDIRYNTTRRNYWVPYPYNEYPLGEIPPCLNYDADAFTIDYVNNTEIYTNQYQNFVSPTFTKDKRDSSMIIYYNNLSSHNNILGWGTWDEPCDGAAWQDGWDKASFTWAALKNRMQNTRSNINSLNAASSNNIPPMTIFRVYPNKTDPIEFIYDAIHENVSQFILLDWYPIWSNGDISSRLIPEQIFPAIEIIKHHTQAGPFVYVAQGQEYDSEPENPSNNYLSLPSEKNFRYMTYAPIIHGARGIMYYNYYNTSTTARNEVHKMIAEITGTSSYSGNSNSIDLTDVIMSGITPSNTDFLKVLNNSHDNTNTSVIQFMKDTTNYSEFSDIEFFDINFLLKQKDGYTYLFICNDCDNAKTVKLFSEEISYGIMKEITKDGLGVDQRINHGKFSIDLDGCEAKVFRIQEISMTNAYDLACLSGYDTFPLENFIHIMRPCSTSSTVCLMDRYGNNVSNPYYSGPRWTYWNSIAEENLKFNEDVDHAVAGDFDGDGYDDIALWAFNQLYLLENGGEYFDQSDMIEVDLTEDLEVSNSYISNCANIDMLSGDFDADGKDEVCIIENATLGFDIDLININGSSCSKILSSTSMQNLNCTLYFSASGDFDADGKDDIVLFYTINSTNYVKVFSLNSSYVFVEKTTFANTTTLNYNAIEYLDAGDMNNDGYSDFALLYDQGNLHDFQRVLVFISDGEEFPLLSSTNILVDANWHVVPSATFNFDNVTSMVVEDFTGDANDDVLVTYNQTSSLQKFIVYKNNSTGTGFVDGTTFDPKTKYWDYFSSSTYDLSDQYFMIAGRFMFNPGQGLYKKVEEREIDEVFSFNLQQNYPNPFNPSTTITYEIPKASTVRLNIYNTSGQLVKTLINENHIPGHYSVAWDASNLPSGLYIYKLEAGDYIDVKKCMLIK